MPSTIAALLFLNFLYHNITTRNSKLSTLFLILHSHTSQWIFISLILYTINFALRHFELTIKRPHSIIPRIFWCQRPVMRHVSMRRVRPWWMSSVGATKTTWTMENPPWHEMSWNVDECSVLLIGDFPRKKHEKNLMIGVRTVGGNFCLGLPRQPWRKLIDRFATPPPCLSCWGSGLRNMAWDI